MNISNEEAITILGLMGVADLERGLTPDETALKTKIIKRMSAVGRDYLESAFQRDTWAGAAEESPEVKAMRVLLEKSATKHGPLAPTEAFFDLKNHVHDRIMMSVQEGWVF